MKAKSEFFIHWGPEPDVKTLTARVRESAEGPPEGGSGSLSLEGVLRAQAEVNAEVSGSLRLVAQHLQYAQEQFAAVEQSIRDEEDERARADGRAGERLEEIAAAVEGLNRRVEAVVEKLAALEERFEREVGGPRRGRQALPGAAATPPEE